MASVSFEHVTKTFPDGTHVIDGLDLEVGDGELLVLVGPSGCGKSTVLRMLAGLEDISGGKIRIGGRVVNDLLPQRRNLSMVFQNYALYPHLTVRGNLEFPLKMKGLSRTEIDRRVRETAAMLDLDGLLDRRPKALSGGQRQRVAMGRAIAREADAFLMDEPLSNLDARLRVQIRTEIAALQTRLGVTTIYVTHDQVEAMTLGQRVAVMRGGRLQQVAPPWEIYRRPSNSFVAGFIGTPGMNLVRAPLVSSNCGLCVLLGDIRLTLSAEALADQPGLADRTGEEVLVGIRPEAIGLAETGATSALAATVRTAESLGHETLLHLDSPLTTVAADAPRQVPHGEPPALIAALRGHHPSRPGDSAHLQIDPGDLHFFALDGEAIH
ncbi:ABC transporter ATP-binding protein [Thiocapsa bogorovii]|uniref:ABC transporter ATP-binding protein n=1 Tax=Thiocapsa bogorovii TaxID=521689 RepID=UPI001E47F1E3|nr:ABC transporter ATP-binding protein [Thiocapsa bogorovii]UHD18585.1 ABC transporter ATP-binding protein [Thiocapsa bogorovii]